VTTDAVLRTVAVVAAVAVAVAPLAWQIKAAATLVGGTVWQGRRVLTRLAVAGVLLAVGLGRLPLPHLAGSGRVTIEIDAPSAAMAKTVQPIVDAFRGASAADRMLWASLWSKAAVVASGDAVGTEVVFSDTRALRAFTVLALEIGWRRIGDHQPGGIPGLRAGVEAAFADTIGTDVVPVTSELRARYAELCKAIGWAALPPRG